jgi:hypothetical protein
MNLLIACARKIPVPCTDRLRRLHDPYARNGDVSLAHDVPGCWRLYSVEAG